MSSALGLKRKSMLTPLLNTLPEGGDNEGGEEGNDDDDDGDGSNGGSSSGGSSSSVGPHKSPRKSLQEIGNLKKELEMMDMGRGEKKGKGGEGGEQVLCGRE
jgi:hypothetical protein